MVNVESTHGGGMTTAINLACSTTMSKIRHPLQGQEQNRGSGRPGSTIERENTASNAVGQARSEELALWR